MGQISCLELSVSSYQPTPNIIQEVQQSQLHQSRNPKFHVSASLFTRPKQMIHNYKSLQTPSQQQKIIFQNKIKSSPTALTLLMLELNAHSDLQETGI
jgi:hypothetical protein